MFSVALWQSGPRSTQTGTLEQPCRATCYSTRGLPAHAREARPVVEVDYPEGAVFADHRVAAPGLQPDRGGRGCGCDRDRATNRLGQFVTVRKRREVFAAAHAVELHHPPFDLLLDVGLGDPAFGEAPKRAAKLVESLHALDIVGAERMKVAALDVERQRDLQAEHRTRVKRCLGADQD